MDKRLRYIDYMKGIGILLVILAHMYELPNSIRIYIYSFHMPLFFFISGYLFNFNKNKEFIPFFKKRIYSLLLPYFLLEIILLIFYFSINTYANAPYNYNEHMISILFGNNIYETNYLGTPWFLVCLFVTEITFQVVSVFLKNKLNLILIVAIISSIVGYSISLLNFVKLPFTIDIAFTAIAFYSFGYLFKNWNIIELVKNKLNYVHVLIICFITNIVFVLLNHYIPSSLLLNDGRIDMIYMKYGNYFSFYLAAIFGILFILYLSILISKKNIPLLIFFGQNSLALMVFHLPINTILVQIFELIGLTGNAFTILTIKMVIILIINSIVILVINRYFPIIIGKKRVKTVINK